MIALSTTQSTSAEWKLRIERAARLRQEQSASAELLDFYRAVLGFQEKIAATSTTLNSSSSPDLPFQAQLDTSLAASYFEALVDVVLGHGPAPLRAAIQDLRERGAGHVREFLESTISAGDATLSHIGSVERFVFLALLQPIAETAAHRYSQAGAATYSRSCPVCSAPPSGAILRPEGDGAKRFMECSFCFTEWSFRRILCPWCEESDKDKLPRFAQDEYPHVRIEGCDTCKRYLKSVDLTLNGNAIPMVDDVATAALDVWATGQGYDKISPNLLGF